MGAGNVQSKRKSVMLLLVVAVVALVVVGWLIIQAL
jgi:hypothetical protein